MKNIVYGVLFLGMLLPASCKKKGVAPVNGTIDGKPALTLYGSSGKPTDYLFIDTVAADKKISYNGVVFTYIYNAATTNIYLINGGIPAADGTLSIGTNVVLTVNVSYSITFGSSLYVSK